MANDVTGVEALTAVAKAAGVTKVYWIDDQFSEAGPQLTSRIGTKVRALLQSSIKPTHATLAKLEFSGIEADDAQKINDLLKGKPGLGHELLQALDHQIAESSPGTEEFCDLSTAQVDLIAKCFPAVERLSFAAWKASQAALLQSPNENVLFLIDHDFSLEDGCGPTQGRDILKPLISNQSQRCFCILFTHNLVLGKEQEEREIVAKAMGVPEYLHRFSVVGKEHIRIPNQGGEAPLAKAFQDSFIREWCHLMVTTTQQIFVSAFDDTKKELMALTFDEISSAFFRRSGDDGTSEFDVLVRVMMLAGRVALEDSRPKHDDLWKRLAKIREVMVAADYLPSTAPPLSGSMKLLRSREIWDTKEYINGSFMPPCCGDVFESTKDHTMFVLVGQPCHLMIRRKGDRDDSEALLLRVLNTEPALGKGYKFDFPGGEKWVSFVKAYPVNLYLLDIVGFNADGALKIAKDDKPSQMLLPGVRRHFDKLVGYLKSYKSENRVSFRYMRLTLNDELYREDVVIKNGTIELPFRRIGRIRSPHAEAILGGLAVCHTRMAFDYDFSREPPRVLKPKEHAKAPAPEKAANPVLNEG